MVSNEKSGKFEKSLWEMSGVDEALRVEDREPICFLFRCFNHSDYKQPILKLAHVQSKIYFNSCLVD